MKALLIYPEFPDTYWSFRHALKLEGRRSAFPPLGLLTVSAMLPESWERRLVDLNVRRLKDSDIDWADLVFASAMIVQKESLEKVVAREKARGKRVVVGGPYVSTSAERLPEADHIFVGEAEATLPNFIEDLEAGRPERFYRAPERPALTPPPAPPFPLLRACPKGRGVLSCPARPPLLWRVLQHKRDLRARAAHEDER